MMCMYCKRETQDGEVCEKCQLKIAILQKTFFIMYNENKDTVEVFCKSIAEYILKKFISKEEQLLVEKYMF